MKMDSRNFAQVALSFLLRSFFVKYCALFFVPILYLLTVSGCQRTPVPVIIYCPETLYDTFVQIGESFYTVNGVPIVLDVIEEAGQGIIVGVHKTEEDENGENTATEIFADKTDNNKKSENDVAGESVAVPQGPNVTEIAPEVLEKVELLHHVGNGDYWICDSPRQKDLLLSKAFVKESQTIGYAKTVLYTRKGASDKTVSLDDLAQRGGTLGVLAARGSGMGDAAAKVLQAREGAAEVQVLEYLTPAALFEALRSGRVAAVIAWDYLEKPLTGEAERVELAENEVQTVVVELLVLTSLVEVDMPTKFRRFLTSQKARNIFKENGLVLY